MADLRQPVRDVFLHLKRRVCNSKLISFRRILTERRIRYRHDFLERFGEKVFDQRWAQWLLGFRKTRDAIVDFLPSGLHLEYGYHSAIGRQLFYRGQFEDAEIAFFAERLGPRPSPVILDIGGNIGIHSISWAKQLPNSVVYAVEPAPQTADVLKRNISLNRANNVLVLRTAVSDHCGEAEFCCCEDDAFSSLKDTRRRSVISRVVVPLTTIDDIVQSKHITNVDLIKIDVEGFEKEVVAGAVATLRAMRPELFVEIYGGTDSNPDPTGTVDFICGLGFDAFVLVEGKPVPYERHNDDLYNYYFRPSR